jgi:hypothetical protein
MTTKTNKLAEMAESLEMEIGNNIHELTRKSSDFHQSGNNDGKMSATDLGMLLRQVSESSTREIDSLIGELRALRNKLETDGIRIQSDIERHAELSQGVMQLTTIVSDNVKNLPSVALDVSR